MGIKEEDVQREKKERGRSIGGMFWEWLRFWTDAVISKLYYLDKRDWKGRNLATVLDLALATAVVLVGRP